MFQLQETEIGTIGDMWKRLVEDWKPSLAEDKHAALMTTIAPALRLYSGISRSDTGKVSLVDDARPPFVLAVVAEEGSEKWGIRCSFLGQARWLGGVTHPHLPAVNAAFEAFISDIRSILFHSDLDTSGDPEMQWGGPKGMQPISTASHKHSRVGDPPPMVGAKDIITAIGNMRLPTFFLFCSLAGLVIFAAISFEKHRPHAAAALPPPAASQQATTANVPPQVIGSTGTALPSVQSVLKGKMPTIPIPGGGTITDKAQYKAFGMTPGPEMANSAQTSPQS